MRSRPLTVRTPRVVAARKLLRPAGRLKAGRFLVEGAQAVRAARAAGAVEELYLTAAAADRHPDLAADALVVEDAVAVALSETVTPQGVLAVCPIRDVGLDTALAGSPRLVAVLAGVSDPGNAGTVIRVADAAGADAVVLAGEAVDPHNGKCVRASTGSLFHLPVVRERDAGAVLAACRAAGLRVLAADAAGERVLPDLPPGPAAWVFGSETHGVPDVLRAAADDRVRVPILGRAESLNLATAAAVCLYASALAGPG